jgi:hypothetical protein
VENRIWQPIGFVGFDRYPGQPRNYGLFYTQDYRERLSELDFGVAFPGMWACPSNDYDLKNLLITVRFTRIASEKTQRTSSRMIDQWFTSVSEKGILGE